MRLQLDNSISGPAGSGSLNGARPADQGTVSADTGTGPASLAAGDRAVISGVSALISRLSADQSSRIDQLSASVQDGSYQIPSGVISRSIVAESLVRP